MEDRLGIVGDLDRKNKAIDKVYIEYTTPRCHSEAQKNYNNRIKIATDILVKKLNINLDHISGKERSNHIFQQIKIKMDERNARYGKICFLEEKERLQSV